MSQTAATALSGGYIQVMTFKPGTRVPNTVGGLKFAAFVLNYVNSSGAVEALSGLSGYFRVKVTVQDSMFSLNDKVALFVLEADALVSTDISDPVVDGLEMSFDVGRTGEFSFKADPAGLSIVICHESCATCLTPDAMGCLTCDGESSFIYFKQALDACASDCVGTCLASCSGATFTRPRDSTCSDCPGSIDQVDLPDWLDATRDCISITFMDPNFTELLNLLEASLPNPDVGQIMGNFFKNALVSSSVPERRSTSNLLSIQADITAAGGVGGADFTRTGSQSSVADVQV